MSGYLSRKGEIMKLNKDSQVPPMTPQQRAALKKFVQQALACGDGSFTPLHLKQCGNFLWVIPHNQGARFQIKNFVRENFPDENVNYAVAHPGWLEKYFK